MTLEVVSATRFFAGTQYVYAHDSEVLGSKARFGLYVPDAASDFEKTGRKLRALFWLSGLTCTEANFIDKSGFQRAASLHQLVVLNPDTSPRGIDLPGDSDSWDFGKGAGFYVDATEAPWSTNYKMWSYVTVELPKLVAQQFQFVDTDRLGVFGHSMGGHGALIAALKRPDLFKSASAFAPIANPTNCDWGKKAFAGYLGTEDKEKWAQYDAAILAKNYAGPQRLILVEQGADDPFLPKDQLNPQSLVSNANVHFEIRLRAGHGHGYGFIATFIDEHFAHHAAQLDKQN